MELQRFPARHVHNPLASREAPFGEVERAILGQDAVSGARCEIETWPGYAPTPLRSLPGLAARLGLGSVRYKDEGGRFGLGSFKALGGAYAVFRLLQQRIGERTGTEPSAADLMAGLNHDSVGKITVATATDGNHGRSVAWGAQQFGCRCVIYIHEGVSRSPGGGDSPLRG